MLCSNANPSRDQDICGLGALCMYRRVALPPVRVQERHGVLLLVHETNVFVGREESGRS